MTYNVFGGMLNLTQPSATYLLAPNPQRAVNDRKKHGKTSQNFRA